MSNHAVLKMNADTGAKGKIFLFVFLLGVILTFMVSAGNVSAQDQPINTIANPSGTTMNLFDYSIYNGNTLEQTYRYNNTGINNNNRLFKFMKDHGQWGDDYETHTPNTNWINVFTGAIHDDEGGNWFEHGIPNQGIVDRNLGADGYPRLSREADVNQESLAYLFDPSPTGPNNEDYNTETYGNNQTREKRDVYTNVNRLLAVDEEGYYYFDSDWERALLQRDTCTGKDGCDFEVVDPEGDARPEFLPFRDPDNPNQTSDYFMGMHMQIKDFSIPQDGKVVNPYGEPKDMDFTFHGDDDVWVFIDGVLVGDVGGIHWEEELEINFQNGNIRIHNHDHPEDSVPDTTLRQQFELAGASEEYMAANFEEGSNTFKAGTYHTLDFFYLERGGNPSNLYIRYNLISTYDFTSHKSVLREGQEDPNLRLNRNDYLFRLTGYPGVLTDLDTGEIIDPDTSRYTPPIMPMQNPDQKLYWHTNYLQNDDANLPHIVPSSGQWELVVGNSEDGNVNFGNGEVEATQWANGTMFYYKYEELPPDGATLNADGVTYNYHGKTVSANPDGTYTFGNMVYDLRPVYFTGTKVSDRWISKTYYTGPDYRTKMPDDYRFAGFTNAYGASGDFPLSGTKRVEGLLNEIDEERVFEYTLRYTGYPDEEPVMSGFAHLTDSSDPVNIAYDDHVYLTRRILADLVKDPDGDGPKKSKAEVIGWVDDTAENPIPNEWKVYYTLTEVTPGYKDIEPNTQQFNITVTVHDYDDGTLVCVITGITDENGQTVESIEFVNTERENVPVGISGRKILQGRSLTTSDKWIYTLTPNTTGAPMPAVTAEHPNPGEVQNTLENFNFGNIIFMPDHLGDLNSCQTVDGESRCGVKTYYYEVVESNAGTEPIPGVTNDQTKKEFSVTVWMDDQGVFHAEQNSANLQNDLTFTNVYRATGSVQLDGTKQVKDEDHDTTEARDFYFTLSYLPEGSTNPVEEDQKITLFDGSTEPVTFNTINYLLNNQGQLLIDGINNYAIDAAGTDDSGHRYWTLDYTIKEQPSTDLAMKPNFQVFIIRVTVTDDGVGNLETTKAMCEYDTRTATTCTPTSAEAGTEIKFAFTNEERNDVDVEISGTKSVEGRVPSGLTEYDVWAYTIEADDDNPPDTPMPHTLTVFNNTVDGKYSFGKIVFTPQHLSDDIEHNRLAQYTYIITESGTVQDIANDHGAHVVTISLWEDPDTHELMTSVASEQGTDFINTYYDGDSTILAARKKVMSAVNPNTVLEIWPAGTQSFRFKLTGLNDVAKQKIHSTTGTTQDWMQADAIQTRPRARFTPFVFSINDYEYLQDSTHDPDYRFLVEEVVPSQSECEADGNDDYRTNSDGSITCGGVTYATVSYEVKIELAVDENNKVEPTIWSRVNGQYTNPDDGWNIVQSDDPVMSVGDFENRYQVTPAKLTLQGQKQVIDADGDKTEEREFLFDLVYAANENMKVFSEPVSLTINDGTDEPATFSFPQITYTRQFMAGNPGSLTYLSGNNPQLATRSTDAAGRLIWTIRYYLIERDPEDNAIKPNAQKHAITVTVTDDGKGKLTASSTPDLTVLLFENYEYNDDPVPVSGLKYIPQRSLKDGETWTFVLYSDNPEEAPLPKGYACSDTVISQIEQESWYPGDREKVKCTTNDIHGLFDFGNILFTPQHLGDKRANASYGYHVTEIGTVPGVSNSTSTLDFTVTVSVATGSLKATVNKTFPADLTFTNNYNEPGTVVFEALKTMEGGIWSAGTSSFQFLLTAVNAPAIQKIVDLVGEGKTSMEEEVTQANPAAVFDGFRFTLSDYNSLPENAPYYHFTLEEKKPTRETCQPVSSYSEHDGVITCKGVTYDGHVRDIYVKLTQDTTTYQIVPHVYFDSLDSTEIQLPASGTYNVGTWNNTYNPSPVRITLGGWKTMKNNDGMAEDRTFTFNLNYAADGSIAAQVNNLPITDGQTQLFRFLYADEHPYTFEYTREFLDELFSDYKASRMTDDNGIITWTIPYLMTEVVSAQPLDVIYDKKTVRITVTVTDDGSGTLTAVSDPEFDAAAADPLEDLTFANDERVPVDIPIPGQKVLEGRDLTEDDKWTFILWSTTAGAPIPAPANTVTCPSDAPSGAVCVQNGVNNGYNVDEEIDIFDFGSIKFTSFQLTENGGARTYKYYVKESSETTVPHVSIASAEREFTVTVSADPQTGKLKVECDPELVTDTDPKAYYLTYTNTYVAKEKVAFEAEKDMQLEDGSTMQIWPAGLKFTFSLKGTDPLSEAKINSIGGTEGVITATADNSVQVAHFEAFTFDNTELANTYNFTLTEVIPNDPTCTASGGVTTCSGVTYSSLSYNIEVTLKMDEDTGDIIPTVVSTPTLEGSSSNIFRFGPFVNKYNPKDVPVQLKASKQVIDADGTAEDRTFDFRLTYADQNKTPVFVNEENEPVDVTLQIKDGEIKFGENGVVFPEINYSRTFLAELVANGRATRSTNDDGYLVWTIPYLLTEVATEDPEMMANSQVFEVIVTVTDDWSGELKASVVPVEALLAFVNRERRNVNIPVSGRKILKGRNLTLNDKWTYILTSETAGAPMPPQPTPVPEGCPTDAVCVQNEYRYYDFGSIVFTPQELGEVTDQTPNREKEYIYKVIEVGSIDGVTNDSSAATGKTFKVRVSINSSNNLQAVVIEPENQNLIQGLTFTNIYKAEGKGEIKVTKDLQDRPWLDGDSFEFTITGVPDTSTGQSVYPPMPENCPASGDCTVTISDVDGAQNHTASFGKIDFTAAGPGTYTYKVKETVPDNRRGVTYDTTEHTVTFYVEDDGKGNLVAIPDGTEIQTETFTNTYEPAPVTHQLYAKKVLQGRDWTNDDSFIFFIEPVDNAPVPAGSPMITITNADASSQYKKAFGDITFTEPGTYSYNVTEIHNNIGGVTYETGPKRIKVYVKDDQTQGKLVVACDPDDGTACTEETLNATFTQTFTNTYNSSGEGEIKVTKNLVGRNWQEGDTFTFTITGVPDTSTGQSVNPPMPANCPASGACTVTINDVNGAQNHTATFGKIDFTDAGAGTYVYMVQEERQENQDERMNYDLTPKRVEITIIDDGQGHLVAAENSQLVNTVTVTNTFGDTGTGQVRVKKNLIGRDWTDNDVFSFRLTSTGSTTPMPECVLTQAGCVIEIKKDQKDNYVSFGDIEFTEEGTYIYTVTEIVPEDKQGITYDQTDHTVIIAVVKNPETGELGPVSGTLMIQTAEFTNTYAETGEGEIKVRKDFTGREWDNNDAFIFTITGVPDTSGSEPVDPPMPAGGNTITITKADVDDDENYIKSFGTIIFTEPGEYNYTVTEFVNGIPGVTYGANNTGITRDVTFTVRSDNSGSLSVSCNLESSTAVFTNTYSAQGNAVLKAKKELSGADWPENGVIRFTLAKVEETIDGVNVVPPMPAACDSDPDACTVSLEAPGTVPFPAISYSLSDAGKTYKYQISETAEGFGTGWTMVTQPVTVQVEVGEDTGTGILTVTGTPGDLTALFTNVYTPAPTEGEIKVTKDLQNRNWQTGDSFTFTLAAENGAPMPERCAAQAACTVTIAYEEGATEHTASFGKIPFTEAGTYIYTVTENVPAEAARIPGVTYDGTPHYVTIKVRDNAGTLVADGTDLIQTVEITNTYEAKGEGEIKVTKNLTNRAWKNDDVFIFTITAQAGTPMPAGGDTVIVRSTSADHTETFGKITFTKAGTYTYTVTEVNNGISGVTYADPLTQTVTIKVKDNNDGTLVADGTDLIQTLTFTNTYSAQGNAVLKVKKELNGAGWPSGKSITFTLTAADGTPLPDGCSASASCTVRLSEAGTVSFPAISYSLSDATKTYTYTITEDLTGFGGGWSAAQNPVTVQVKVGADTGTGILTVTGTPEDLTALFTNVYKPAPATGEIKVTKDLQNRNWQTGDSFTFTIAKPQGAAEDYPMPANSTVTITNGTADHTSSFGPIRFTAAGTYIYTVTESEGNIAGVTYDTTPKYITFKVKDDGGQLVADGTDLNQTVTITNPYNPTGTGTIKVEKTLNGADWPEGGSIAFVLSGSNGAPMPAGAKGNTVTLTAAGTESFAPITYELKDAGKEYTYTVTEYFSEEFGSGWTAASNPVTVRVTVSQDTGTGRLDVTCDPTDFTAVFTNTYKPAPADGEILVEKVLKGREWKTGDTFTFTITAADGVPMPSNQSITITNTDEVKTKSFGTITFTKAGEYTYTVTESGTPAIGGITYDTAAKTVRINVEDKNGTLVAAEGSSLIQTVEITNTYTPAPVDGQIKVTKTLDGRDWKEGDSFTFTLAGLNGAPMPAKTTIVITGGTADHTAYFGMIHFTEAGTYFYTVTETRGDITGITYDESVHIVTLTVTDDGSGQLAAETPAVEITNSYAKPVNGQIIVTKNLSGRDWKDGDSFTFNLEGLNNAPMPSKTTVTITDGTADHSAFFGPITFEKEGTYVYQVTEEKGSLTGITYDESVHTVVFIVEKNSSGELDAAAGTTMTPKVIITNTYIVTPVCVQFGGCKSFPNAPEDVQSTEFTYKLSQNGRVIDTATTRGAGAYQFAPFIYSEPGTYSYSVEEEQGNVYGVEYDKHKYEVQVTVERDDSSGKLTATITDQDGNPVTNSNGMNFNNPYTPAARAYIQVEKTLKGGEWPEGASVTFKLEALDGAPLPAKNTVTITRPGTAAFDAITYGIESAGKVYQYTVTEFAENFGGGWSVSPVSVPVTVSITRAEDKTLHTEVTYEQGNTVTNIYNNASIQFHGQKAIKGRRTVPSNMFQFLLEGSDGTHQVVGNDGDVFTFDPVWFTAPGDYTYTITEVQGTDRRVTYDTSSYTINVSVKTDENGDPYVDSVSGDNPERIRFINDMDTTPPTPPRGGNTPPDFPDLLPATGFSAMHVTNLPEKPMDLNYKPLRMMLEIPSLGVSADIVSVPEVDGRYPVTWLGSKAGALEGYAKPGEGRAILAGHNHLNDMEAGPFAMLLDLNKGDRVFLNDGSGLQIYTVYANEKIGANDQERLDQISAQFENSITMITCEDERPEGGYANRRIVAARPL